jgi:Ca2+-binding RTX toxin-like protein
LSRNVEEIAARGTASLALTGNDSNNTMSGGDGRDTLKGLGGNDLIAAADGKDVLYGGKGKDFFMFVTSPAKSNVDTIKDFNHSADTIMLSQYAHGGLSALIPSGQSIALLPESAFYASKSGKAHDADDRVLYDKDDRILYVDADGDGTTNSRQMIARFDANPHLAASDILII